MDFNEFSEKNEEILRRSGGINMRRDLSRREGLRSNDRIGDILIGFSKLGKDNRNKIYEDNGR